MTRLSWLTPAEPTRGASATPNSQDALVEALSRSSAGIAVISNDGLITYTNDRFSTMVGRSSGALHGMHIRHITHPEDWAANAARVQAALLAHGSVELEQRLLHGDGGVVWIRICTSITQGNEPVAIAVCFDISGRKGMEAALRESEGRFRNMADHAPVMMWVTDPSGVCIYLNKAWYRYTGQTEDDALGFGWLSATHPDDRERSEAIFRRANDRREGFSIEYRLRHADGNYRWAIDAASPRFSPDGEFMGYVGSVVDISEQKKAAASLAKQNRELATQLNEQLAERERTWQVSRDLLAVVSPDGTLRSINPAWSALLGRDTGDIEGLRVERLEHPDDLGSFTRHIRACSDSQQSGTFSNRLITQDGSTAYLSWTCVTAEGLVYVVGRDDTAFEEQQEALKITEDALRQSQKMEAVGQLTGGLAHDFNNLLAGISGALDLMKMRLAQGRTSDLNRYVDTAQGAAKRAAALTHRLLAFSRRQTLAPKHLEVGSLIRSMLDLIQRTVGPSISVEYVVPDEAWQVRLDPSQLENALLNLCLNARDAMPNGGRMVIQIANQTLNSEAAGQHRVAPGDYVVLSVADTGVGMPPEVQAKAFDPFFTTKPLGQGTGLGLSMIYGFVRQSGGRAWIRSVEGAGTTVSLLLPRDTQSPLAPSAAAIEPEDIGARAGAVVLLVDDEASIRIMAAEALEDQGYTVLQAGDGPAALVMLQSDMRIDLLLTDVGLPGGLNGRQLADAGRSLRKDLPVLFITGYAEQALFGQASMTTGMHILTKPFVLGTLTAKVTALLEQ
ncbi:PAS domain S-box protein [Pseudomonas sp. Marseille-QA0892]